MEPKGLLLCSEKTANEFYPEPDESSSHPHKVSSRSTLILTSLLNLTNSMQHSPSKRSQVTQLVKKFPAFMEPEGSLLCSKEPTVGLHPEPDASNSHLPILFP